jgi:hypothetical protein
MQGEAGPICSFERKAVSAAAAAGAGAAVVSCVHHSKHLQTAAGTAAEVRKLAD